MDDQTQVVEPDPTEDPPLEGDATPIPPLFFWVLWIPAFAVIIWGMNLLFNRRPPDAPAPPPPSPPAEEEPHSHPS